jgi:hypothetical protein
MTTPFEARDASKILTGTFTFDDDEYVLEALVGYDEKGNIVLLEHDISMYDTSNANANAGSSDSQSSFGGGKQTKKNTAAQKQRQNGKTTTSRSKKTNSVRQKKVDQI